MSSNRGESFFPTCADALRHKKLREWHPQHCGYVVIRELTVLEFTDTVLSMCPHWDRLHPIFYGRPSMIPLFVSDSVGDLSESGTSAGDGQTASNIDNYDGITAPGQSFVFLHNYYLSHLRRR